MKADIWRFIKFAKSVSIIQKLVRMMISHSLHENLVAFLLSTPLSLDEYVSKLKTVKTKVMETNVLHTSYPMHFLGTLCDLEGRDANAIISILFLTFLQPT